MTADEIVAILDAIDRKIDLHRIASAPCWRSLFKALLHKLMTARDSGWGSWICRPLWRIECI